MAQIIGATVTLLLLLTVSLFFQDTTAWACCRRYSKGQVHISLIQGYSIQTIQANCNINAVILHTYNGRKICMDPSQTWVTNTIKKIRAKVLAVKKIQKQ